MDYRERKERMKAILPIVFRLKGKKDMDASALAFAIEKGVTMIGIDAYDVPIPEDVRLILKENQDRLQYQVRIRGNILKKDLKSILKQLDALRTELGCRTLDTIFWEGTNLPEDPKQVRASGLTETLGVAVSDPLLAEQLYKEEWIDRMLLEISPEEEAKSGFGLRGKEHMFDYLSLEAKHKELFGISRETDREEGILLDPVQRMQYQLDRPGVKGVWVSFAKRAEAEAFFEVYGQKKQRRSYRVLGTLLKKQDKVGCVYCESCYPCPVGIRIADVNRYFDRYKKGDVSAKKEYLQLERLASDCIRCGNCNRRCPYHVAQKGHMKKIAEILEDRSV